MLTRRNLLGGAVAGLTAGLAPLSLSVVHARGNDPLYQAIWDEDMRGNGLPAISPRDRGDGRTGYVRVDESRGGRNHRIFDEVSIPKSKQKSYDLARALFDNYALDQTKAESANKTEAREMLALLDFVSKSGPMALLREEAGERRGKTYALDAWQNLLFEIWFKPFDMGRNKDLTGFEHVIIGEQNRGSVGGQHFWYYYHLEDSGELDGTDAIDFDRYAYRRRIEDTGFETAEIVTLAYEWHALDRGANQRRPLYQEIGGFWVGCSIEGLMALGTARFLDRARDNDPVEAVIEDRRYELKLFRSPDRQSMRTFYPILKG